jgi:hypothetical protein
MARDPHITPQQASGKIGAEPTDQPRNPDASIDGADTTGADNRGRQASYEGSGGVSGSGAGAGGGGGPEEYDSDPQGGGGKMAMPASSAPKPDRGGDAPQHGSR